MISKRGAILSMPTQLNKHGIILSGHMPPDVVLRLCRQTLTVLGMTEGGLPFQREVSHDP